MEHRMSFSTISKLIGFNDPIRNAAIAAWDGDLKLCFLWIERAASMAINKDAPHQAKALFVTTAYCMIDTALKQEQDAQAGMHQTDGDEIDTGAIWEPIGSR